MSAGGKMSRLDELIAELCPDGVEYRKIGEVVSYEQPTKYIVTSTDYEDTFLTPVLTAGKSFILGYTNETEGIYFAQKDKPVIIFDDFTGAFKWVDFPFKVKSSAMKMLKANEIVTTLRYIYHVMGFLNYSSTEHTRLWISVYSEFLIPLPPLEVQREIVRILDAFTELDAELNAELDARKKQYEYYRDDLLRFGDTVEWKPLGELFPFIRNGFVGTVTPYFTDAENGVRYLEGTNIHNGTITDNEVFYVTREFHEQHQRTELKADDILMVQSGHVGECAVVGDKYAGANCHALIVMSNGGKCNSRFIMHYFNSKEGKNKLKKITTGGTIKHILASSMKKYVVPLPSLAEQERIVAILDRFDKLCNDISSGIPAEIEARRKQYEHYRDRLLTFKEKTA